MPKKKGAHHSLDDKMRDRKHAQRGRTLSRDCREAQASPTTVSNEVKLSRALQCPRRRRRGAQGARLRQGRALPPLAPPMLRPASAAARSAVGTSAKGSIRMSAKCKSGYCTLEKARYVASRAQAAHDALERSPCRHSLRTGRTEEQSRQGEGAPFRKARVFKLFG